MKRIICRLFGHRWAVLWAAKNTDTMSCLVCVRCHENAWS